MNYNKKNPARKAASVVMMGTLCAVSIFSVKTFARDVYVNVDNSTIHSVTLDSNVDSILGNVGVKVSDNDIVEKIDNPDGSLKLNVKRAFDVNVWDGEKIHTLKIVEGKVSDVLESLGVNLSENDIVNLPLDFELTKETKISVTPRVKITVFADGEEKEYIVPKHSVKDTLDYLKINLSNEDEVDQNASLRVYDGMKINVSRIKKEEVTVTEDIPRNTVVKTSTLLSEGSTEVTCEGKDGKKELRIKQTLKDGNVIDSEILESKIIENPEDKVVVKGTGKIKPKNEENRKTSSESNGGKASNVFFGYATAYTASPGAKTSTGVRPSSESTVAVNPKVIPYGSRILVEAQDGSYRKELIAQDTGGALKKGSAIVDIYMSSKDSCKKFGRKSVKVSIIK